MVPAVILAWFVFQYAVAPAVGISPNSDRWLLVFSVQTAHPEYYWSYGTAVLSHVTVEHLVVNVVSIVLLTPLVERSTGHRSTLALIVVSGVIGSVTFAGLGCFGEVDGIGMGASGAVYGLVGFLLPTILFTPPKDRIDAGLAYGATLCSVSLFVIAFNQMYASWASASALADAAHVAGFLAGVFYWCLVARVGLFGDEV